MAAVRVRQHQHQQVQQPITPPSPQPTIIRRKKTKQKFEKTMLIALIGIIVVLAVVVLNKQAAIQTTSMDIQKSKQKQERLLKGMLT